MIKKMIRFVSSLAVLGVTLVTLSTVSAESEPKLHSCSTQEVSSTSCKIIDTSQIDVYAGISKELYEDYTKDLDISSETTVDIQKVDAQPVTSSEKPEQFYYDIPLSQDLQDSIRYYLDYMKIDLDETYIYALIYHESRFNPNAVGACGDSGYCQILQRYFGGIYDSLYNSYPELVESENMTRDPFDQKSNIACGIYQLNSTANSLSGYGVCVDNLSMSLTGYNRGVGGARKLYRSSGSYQSSYSREIIEIAHTIQDNKGISVK